MGTLVKCTLLRDLGKMKRGDIVTYDAFKAEARAKAGFVAIGEKKLPEIATVTKSEEPQPKPKRKKKTEEGEE